MVETTRVRKRYSNRKLYDTGRSSYITLDEIAVIIKDGEKIQIVDNKTHEDLTSVTLAQVLVEEEKRQTRSGRSLRGLIEHSGELLQKRLGEPVTHLRSSVEDSVTRLIRTGEERATEKRAQLQSFFDQSTPALDDLQTRLDRVRHLFAGGAALESLQADLVLAQARLDRIERHLGLPTRDEPAS